MFDILRRPTAGLLLTAFLSSQLGGLGCSAAPTEDDTVQAGDEALSYDGETLFRGIFFGTGAAATKLPELWSNSAAASLVTKALQTSPTSAAAQLRAYASIARTEGSSTATVTTLTKAADLLARTKLSSADFANRLGDARSKLLADRAAATVIAKIREKKPTFFKDFGNAIQSGDRVRIQAAVKTARVALLDEWCGTTPRPPIPSPWPGGVSPNPGLAADVTVDVETAIYAVAVVAVAVVAVAVWVVGLEATNVTRLQSDRFVDLLATRFKSTVVAPTVGIVTR
jgi:SdpC family antimicrobial peptide